jgi:hypothetical protein
VSEEPEIAYSVRELIERLDRKIDGFLSIMTSKADRSDVALQGKTLTDHETRIRALESRVANDEKAIASKRDWRRWRVEILATIVLAGVTALSILTGVHW